jgi:hypothetical protein
LQPALVVHSPAGYCRQLLPSVAKEPLRQRSDRKITLLQLITQQTFCSRDVAPECVNVPSAKLQQLTLCCNSPFAPDDAPVYTTIAP